MLYFLCTSETRDSRLDMANKGSLEFKLTQKGEGLVDEFHCGFLYKLTKDLVNKTRIICLFICVVI